MEINKKSLKTTDFLMKNYLDLNISKEFISYSDMIKIRDEYDFDERVLSDFIDLGNVVFIDFKKPIVITELFSFFYTHKKIINKNEFSDIKSKFYKPYFDFFNELNFERLIQLNNYLINNSIDLNIFNELNDIILDGVYENKTSDVKSKFLEVAQDIYFENFNILINDLNKLISLSKGFVNKSLI